MASTILNEYQPDSVSPPGETLEEVLDDRSMSQAELAERTGRPRKTVNEIIQGKAAITPETALQFERVLGVPARFWLEREQHYREFLARQQDDAMLAQHLAFLDEVPTKAMSQAGWIEAHNESIDQLRAVLRFFGIAAPAQYDIATVAFRRAPAFRSDPGTVAAWLRRGEALAQEINCAPFDEAAFRSVLTQARALTCEPFTQAREELPRLCATAGVAVVIVPELPKTCVCGATRWLTPTKALIQLSLRYKTDDQFWFSFFHEAGHILLHGKRAAFVDEEQQADDQREGEANGFAMDTLIPPAELRAFLSRRGTAHISTEMVRAFADQLDIAPDIVVGRLQHDGMLQRSHLNGLKRSLIIKSVAGE